MNGHYDGGWRTLPVVHFKSYEEVGAPRYGPRTEEAGRMGLRPELFVSAQVFLWRLVHPQFSEGRKRSKAGPSVP
jgi:hypothetical protein